MSPRAHIVLWSPAALLERSDFVALPSMSLLNELVILIDLRKKKPSVLRNQSSNYTREFDEWIKILVAEEGSKELQSTIYVIEQKTMAHSKGT